MLNTKCQALNLKTNRASYIFISNTPGFDSKLQIGESAYDKALKECESVVPIVL